MHATVNLAQYVSHLRGKTLPVAMRQVALRCVLDLLGAAAAGFRVPAVRSMRDVARRLYGRGSAAAWFADEGLTSAGAVFCNSSAAAALDLDDGNRAARGHPGAAVIPAAFAVAAETGATADDLLAAIVAGYEIGVRVAHSRNAAQATVSRQSGRWAGYAAVAAAGYLRHTPEEKLAHAFAITGVTAPNQEANGSSGYSTLTGNDVKEGIAWGAASGITALLLAEAGVTGPLDILDHASHFDTALLLDGLDVALLDAKICETYFKPYSCCRYNHAAIDAFARLMAENDLHSQDVSSIAVHTFGWALKLGNKTEPRNLVDVQYSIPYCLAVAALRGADALLPVSEDVLNRREIEVFAQKVTLYHDPELDACFPEQTLARVTVAAAGNVYLSPVTTPRGEPSRPLSWDELREKFLIVSRGTLPAPRQDLLLEAVDRLDKGDLRPLQRALAISATGVP